ncbi:GntR family transcriptional regulator [Ruegeria sp. HKCCD8929]|uniref:GntR family transcriptional regulator n=1 Tax=Ruegeria sp. HKCCD8929 TaxID=2683006 RepID=UPI001489F65E|nr:GntR family transcriptional regulator [Ruegeria sp. HKCCD8929]
MTEILQIKRPDSLSKTAEDHIRKGIINGTFRLGEALPEVKLSNAMGISKTPIREALSALNLQGLVQIFPHRGAFVFSLSQEDVVQLCQYRLILESAAMEQAIDKNSYALLDELADTVSKMSEAREADEFEQYLELDAEFHHAFFRHCENSYLRDGYQKVGDIVQTMRTHLSKRSEQTAKSFAEHEAIVTFLCEGKVKAAKNTLKRQITRGERSYSDLVGVNQM